MYPHFPPLLDNSFYFLFVMVQGLFLSFAVMLYAVMLSSLLSVSISFASSHRCMFVVDAVA